MLNWMLENWYMIVAGIAVLVVLGAYIYKFIKLPNNEKLIKMKKTLLYWVTIAEKEYGSGTGAVKLLYVYNLFTSKYKFISLFVSFDTFSKWVDDALDKMRELLEKNEAVKELVNGNNLVIKSSLINNGTMLL